ncbi:histone-lysine N-methyltransferase SETMAR [Plakobranchus ocellatus]|uniref:Histone-lysine N-methyltransferase SETMAR n=1 Tax=Plakobranchus ocellatus TaxID=259542 RepID=A0AAV4BIG0_9GAST|nr:histone-lysine N-methyltransferase SETMAR [Plakobranchus ocellatus]
MATVFWDSRGMILLDILPKGESVNADRYCETLDLLRHAFRRKRPGLLRSGVAFITTMQPPTRKNAQRNDLNVTGGTLFLIQPTVQTLHHQTFIYLGPLSATWEAKSLRMKMNSLEKFVIGFQSLTQTFSHRVYTRFSHGGKNA